MSYSHTFVINAFTAQGLAVLCWSPWLIPHNVLLNAQNAGSAGKRTRPGVHRPNGPQFNMAIRITLEHRTHEMHEPEFEPYIVWHTSQSSHTIWCSLTRPHCHWDWRRDWLCDGSWTLGMGQWDIHIFFLHRDQCFTHAYWHGEFART